VTDAADLACVIIIPVLGRPHRVAPLLKDIEAATPEPHRALFVADVDDPDEIQALEDAGAEYITVDRPRNYSAKINAAYRATTEPVLLAAADDLHFHPGWLTAALAHLSETVCVVGTNDMGNPRVMKGEHSTHTLFTREYIETRSGVIDRPNTVMNEDYPHDYCDDEFVGTAKARKCFAMAFDSYVEHLHHAWGKGEKDAVYVKAEAMRRTGRRLFIRRRALWRHL
jgi:glycosyltransferase involved in cell wall biosynthesis